jgi:hypothetical protein
MNRAFLIAPIAVTLLASTAAISPAKAAGAVAPTLLEQANLWQAGQPIPPGLLEYRKPGGVPSIIAGITNAPFLVELAFDSRTAERVFGQAVDRALHLAGPQNFFDDVGRRYQDKPEWLLFPRHKRLFTEANQRHVVVDAMFIGESEMPVRDAFEALRHMINDLQSGKSWDGVFSEYSLRLRSEIQMGASSLPSTKEKPLTMSKVAQFGPAVLCERTGSDERFVSDILPPEHRAALLKGGPGEVLLIQDAEHRRVVLYRVRELYLPQKGIHALQIR